MGFHWRNNLRTFSRKKCAAIKVGLCETAKRYAWDYGNVKF
jgi:hypothetical protein